MGWRCALWLLEAKGCGDMRPSPVVSRRSFLSFAAPAGLVACLAGCSQSPDSTSDGKVDQLMGSLVCSGATSFQACIEEAAEEFMDAHPDVSIAISGGGSGQGISDVRDGKAQIGRSDVYAESKLSSDEVARLQDIRMAVAGVAPVVHPNTGVSNLTTQQLCNVFTGKVTMWSELGGNDVPVRVIERKAGSGTRLTFDEAIVAGVDFASDYRPTAEEDSSGTVVEKVAQIEGAISYVAFSYLDNDGIEPLSIDGVEPTADAVQDGSYKVWAYEHLYTAKDPDALTQAFINFVMSDDVQARLVPKYGLVPLSVMQVSKDAAGTVSRVGA